MGSHSRAEKTRTHKRIVSLASKRFREKGLAGIGIAELMKGAGLTVGGFYKHFDSRDDLVAEALGSAVGPWRRLVDAAASGGPPDGAARIPRSSRMFRKCGRTSATKSLECHCPCEYTTGVDTV